MQRVCTFQSLNFIRHMNPIKNSEVHILYACMLQESTLFDIHVWNICQNQWANHMNNWLRIACALVDDVLTNMIVEPRSSTSVQLGLFSPRVETGRVLTKTLQNYRCFQPSWMVAQLLHDMQHDCFLSAGANNPGAYKIQLYRMLDSWSSSATGILSSAQASLGGVSANGRRMAGDGAVKGRGLATSLRSGVMKEVCFTWFMGDRQGSGERRFSLPCPRRFILHNPTQPAKESCNGNRGQTNLTKRPKHLVS